MPDTAIRVENLSKRYRIGLEEQVHDTFGAAATAQARARVLRTWLKILSRITAPTSNKW